MDSIKLLGFAYAEMLHFGCDNTQSVFFKTAVNFADYILPTASGLTMEIVRSIAILCPCFIALYNNLRLGKMNCYFIKFQYTLGKAALFSSPESYFSTSDAVAPNKLPIAFPPYGWQYG